MRQNLRNTKGAAVSAALRFLGSGTALVALIAGAAAEPDTSVRERLELVTGRGVVPIEVEIADTPARQAVGLMFRTSLADTAGMLFIHDKPREVGMWMRNTYIPLDMVFVRADGTVHRIAAMTEPHSEEIIASRGAVLAVLELNGGAAARHGLKPGDTVRHRAFGNAPAP